MWRILNVFYGKRKLAPFFNTRFKVIFNVYKKSSTHLSELKKVIEIFMFLKLNRIDRQSRVTYNVNRVNFKRDALTFLIML